MGRRNKSYHRSLHEQVHDRLSDMWAGGESKRDDREYGYDHDRIYSESTYDTYKRQCGYFADYLEREHPEISTLSKGRDYVVEYLESEEARGRSAWTLSLERSALAKMYGESGEELGYQPPTRHREDITRSRGETEYDRHFSNDKYADLKEFCDATGCRRNILEHLERDDLWSHDRVTAEHDRVAAIPEEERTRDEARIYHATDEALRYFPNEDYYIHHERDKGGRDRLSPIVGTDEQRQHVIDKMQSTPDGEKVWGKVAYPDIHSHRSEYAERVYERSARDADEIQRDHVDKGTGERYSKDTYRPRGERSGEVYNRQAILDASHALGHARDDVVVNNYMGRR